MKTFYPWPSIGQFANVIHHVKHTSRFTGLDDVGSPIYNNDPLPKIDYIGKVKLHGTSAAISYELDNKTFTFQSRNRLLTLDDDNAGFMSYMRNRIAVLEQLVKNIKACYPYAIVPKKIIVFGEWCGGNIQKSVALCELSKMFVIFGVQYVYDDYTDDRDCVDHTVWMELKYIADVASVDDKIFNIMSFPTYNLTIDFEHPEIAQNSIVEIVSAIEAECPVGKAFNVSGIGEGLVFSPVSNYSEPGLWFKAKGLLHSVSKVKTISAVDIESINSINEFVEMFVTENRMDQMLDRMIKEDGLTFDMKNISVFLRYVYTDVMKESVQEVEKNEIDTKKLGSYISNVAKRWYINKFNTTS